MIRYIDLHCDTVTMLSGTGQDLQKNDKTVTLSAMEQGGALIHCFSAYVPTGLFPEAGRYELAWQRFCDIADDKDALLARHGDKLLQITDLQTIARCEQDGRIGLLFTIEDAGVIGENPERLRTAYDRGVRIASLTWNHENTLAFPNSVDPAVMCRTLKPFGRQTVEQMNELGIVIDVSHLSDGGFWDVARMSKRPFIATHSNSRAVTDHPRNLTDEMIRTIADRGGVMGLNFAADFLSDRRDGHSRVSDMVRHVLHIRRVGGGGVLALGSDFDGIDDEVEIASPAQFPDLFQALEQAGLSQKELEDMWRNNALRVFQECW